MSKVVSFETRVEFFDLVCAGMGMRPASGLVGVSRGTGWLWWRKSGLMGVPILRTRHGGLAGPPPAAPPPA